MLNQTKTLLLLFLISCGCASEAPPEKQIVILSDCGEAPSKPLQYGLDPPPAPLTTFTAAQYNLEISFPGNWPIYEKIYPFDVEHERLGDTWVAVAMGSVNPSGYGQVELQAITVSKEKIKTFKEFCHERYYDHLMSKGLPFEDEKTSDEVSGLPAIRYVFPWDKFPSSRHENFKQLQIVVLTQSNEFYYEFSMGVEESEYQKYLPLFNKVIKTVKIRKK